LRSKTVNFGHGWHRPFDLKAGVESLDSAGISNISYRKYRKFEISELELAPEGGVPAIACTARTE